MSVFEKLVRKIVRGSHVSFKEAEKILFYLGYTVQIRGSHHGFRKKGFNAIVLKRRSQLKPYQIRLLKEVLIDHGYTTKERERCELLP